MSSHALANFEIQKHYQNEPWLSRVYLRNNLPKIKDDAYVINLDEYKSIKTHWRDLSVNGDNGSIFWDATYFDSFGVENIPKEIKKFIGSKNLTNFDRILAKDSIMSGHFALDLLISC